MVYRYDIETPRMYIDCVEMTYLPEKKSIDWRRISNINSVELFYLLIPPINICKLINYLFQ